MFEANRTGNSDIKLSFYKFEWNSNVKTGKMSFHLQDVRGDVDIGKQVP